MNEYYITGGGPERGATEHHDISTLIPWYVNASIGDGERQRVESHLEGCAACREEMHLQRTIYQRMNAEDGIEHLPAPSLRRLQQRLDRAEQSASEMGSARRAQKAVGSGQRPTYGRWSLAASIAALAFALGVLAESGWQRFDAHRAASYYTVTTPKAPVPHAAIRVVFAPTATVGDINAVLGESRLSIVAGPTEVGVYSLAVESGGNVAASFAELRKHPAVQFAERTQPMAGDGVR